MDGEQFERRTVQPHRPDAPSHFAEVISNVVALWPREAHPPMAQQLYHPTRMVSKRGEGSNKGNVHTVAPV
ncbi:hypothetical protein M422DRAFT_33201 [Sphaerobolus stellatus SS14]|uniref:Uncharacterized protein n=1 Tax=Sphaerobolus stellatus (strain SS14) TaxID=990650 RepID=A0A0C9VAK2_SPHS4|nr:hypothetical protein M422DRAFT_33201 [Sphaerobolus stellatus SS14]